MHAILCELKMNSSLEYFYFVCYYITLISDDTNTLSCLYMFVKQTKNNVYNWAVQSGILCLIFNRELYIEQGNP